MKNTKRLLSLLLALIMLNSLFPMSAFAEGGDLEIVDSGTCGENLTWSLDSVGTLTISGTGEMTDFTARTAPWFGVQTNIVSVVIQDGVTSIGDYSFYGRINHYGCLNLRHVTIPDSVTRIGESAFVECERLETLTIPGSVESIGDLAFFDCPNLSDLTLMEGLKTIGNSAFDYCNALSDLALPESLTTIGQSAFGNCKNMTSVTIPKNVSAIGGGVFRDCTSLSQIEVSPSNTSFCSVDGVLFNKSMTRLLRYPCEKPDTTYAIPASVTEMDNYAFYRCNHLEEVTFPEGLTEIGLLVFAECGSLIRVNLPESVTKIQNSAFKMCDSLTSVTVPGNLTSLGFSVFTGCSNLKDVSISGSLEKIDDHTFYRCNSLTNVTLPDSVKEIGNDAFSSCEQLTELPILSGVEKIGYQAFDNCSQLTGDLVLNNLTSLGDYAFRWCSNLSSVTISGSLECVGKDAFAYCFRLKNIKLPNSVTTIGSGAFSSSGLEKITVPENVTSIEYAAFNVCSSLTSIAIPKSVSSIGDRAFNACSALKKVYYGGSKEQWEAISIGTDNTELLNAARSYNATAPQELSIVSQPESFYGHPADTAVFTVEAAGEGLTYQWYFSDNDGETWAKSGSTGYNAAEFHPILRANNSGRMFKCVITDAEGDSVETKAVKMALAASEVTIHTQPESYVGQYYDNATFHVDAEGENLTYLWYFRDSDDADWAQTWASGYNTDTLTVMLMPYRDGRQFRCEIKSGGEHMVYTDAVTMSLAKTDVVIVNQPADVTAKLNTLAEFHVDAEGENLTYRWYVKQSADADWEQSFNEGYNSDTLKVRLYEYRDGYQYKCEIKSGGQNPVETDEVTLRMIAKTAKITAQPESVCSEPNKTVTFSVGATGEELTYQWQFRKSAADAWANTGMTGNQTDTLTVVAIAGRSGYQFRCAVTDSSGSVTYSTAADLKVGVLPKIVSQPQNYFGEAASTAVFSVEAEGEGLTYQWYYKDASGVWTRSGAADAKSDTFSVVAYSYRDGYQYRCAVTNAEGMTVYSDAVTLKIGTAHEHSYGEWQIRTEPSCTEDGEQYRVCSICGFEETEVLEALGHDFGTWITETAPTFYEGGSDYRLCARCGEREQRDTDALTYDPETDTEHGLANFTVVNAQTKEPIAGAVIYYTDEETGSHMLITDEDGKTSLVMPVGDQMISVTAEGCTTRNLKIKVSQGIQEIPVIGLSDKPLYDASVTSKEMNLDEIEAAGIDTSAPGNNHVYEYSVRLDFDVGFDVPELKFYVNDYTQVVSGGFGSGDGDGDESEDSWSSDEGSIFWVNNHFEFYPHDMEIPFSFYPMSENFFLIVHGQVSWLKEMFDVEMLVVNNSQTDTMENLTATLTLPEGLSLAEMTNGAQTASQQLDKIEEGGTHVFEWYVRGDREGSYDLSAALTGVTMPFEEEINDSFKADHSLQVLGGSALHLDFYIPTVAYYKSNYPIEIQLTNVSDKTLYNVSSLVQIVQGMEYFYKNGNYESQILSSGENSTGTIREFHPGDKLIIRTKTNILFESKIMNYRIQQLTAMVNNTEKLLELYKSVKKVATVIVETFSDPLGLFEDAMETLFEDSLEDLTEEKLMEQVDTELEERIFLSKAQAKEFWKTCGLVAEVLMNIPTGNEEIDAAANAFRKDVVDTLKEIREDPKGWMHSHPLEDLIRLNQELETLIGYLLKPREELNIFENLRAVLSYLPVRYILQSTVLTESANSTTSIPWTIHETEYTPKFTGVANLNKYLYSLMKASVGDYYEKKVPFYIVLPPEVENELCAEHDRNYVLALQHEAEKFQALDATGKVTFKAWVEPAESAAPAQTASLNSFLGEQASMVLQSAGLHRTAAGGMTLTCDADDAEMNNGVLTFTGPAELSVTPESMSGGVLHVEGSNGFSQTYEIRVVEDHTCTAGEREILLQPTAEEDGVAVWRCETCGQVLDTQVIGMDSICAEHSFGEWVEDLEPTAEACGMLHRTCEVCGVREYDFTGAVDDSGVMYEISDGEVTVTGVKADFSGDLVIPNEINGLPVTGIAAGAFRDSDSITSVTIPESVTSIGDDAFAGCTALEAVHFDGTREAWEQMDIGTGNDTLQDAEVSCQDDVEEYTYNNQFDYVILNGEIRITTGYQGGKGTLEIPAEIDGYPVTALDDAAFCDSFYSRVIIPASVISIGKGAFSMDGLDEIVVSDDNPNYCSINGDLFSKDKTVLMQSHTTVSGVIEIPSTVTTVDDHAFSGAKNLTEVTFPNSVTSIGKSAFAGCSALTTVRLTDSIAQIGNYAFSSCGALTATHYSGSQSDWDAIEIGSGNERLADTLVFDEPEPTPPPVPECLTYEIQNGAVTITGCDKSYVGTVDIPSVIEGYPVTTIAPNAFGYCRSLIGVTIPDSVTSIGTEAFSRCSGLVYASIGEGVSVIERYTFNGCYQMNCIVLPKGLQEIGYCAFNDCYLDDVYFTGTQTQWDAIEISDVYEPDNGENGNEGLLYATLHCGFDRAQGLESILKMYEYEINDGEVTITGFIFSPSKAVVVPAELEGCPVTAISPYAFEDCASLTSVTLPDSVKSIGQSAFESCSNLEELNLGHGVETIGESAFESCEKLTSVTIAGSVENIGNDAFRRCRSMTEVNIENGVKTIGNSAFDECGKLQSIAIPGSVTSIGSSCFSYCDSLTEIRVSEDNAVYSSQDGLLLNRDGTKLILVPQGKAGKYTIPAGVKEIMDYAFYDCTKLTSVIFGEDVTSVGSSAFNYCMNLTSVTLNAGVSQIAEDAFDHCSYLQKILVPEDNMSFCTQDGVLFTKDGTELIWCSPTRVGEYVIPDTVATIGDNAFYDCTQLTKVTIPESVTGIGDYAFYRCGLTEVTIPENVTSIGGDAFYGCSGLTVIEVPDSVTYLGEYAFADCRNLTSVSLGEGITKISEGVFSSDMKLESIVIPAGVTLVEENAFGSCEGLRNVYFTGSQAQWDQIEFEGEFYDEDHEWEDPNYVLNATIHYNYVRPSDNGE